MLGTMMGNDFRRESIDIGPYRAIVSGPNVATWQNVVRIPPAHAGPVPGIAAASLLRTVRCPSGSGRSPLQGSSALGAPRLNPSISNCTGR